MTAPTPPSPRRPTSKYLTGSLWWHVVQSAVAGSIGLLALFASDFVDIFFISMLGEKYLVAAVGYAATVTFFSTSLVIGLAIGTGVLVGKNLGAGNVQEASRVATSSVVIAFCLCTVLAVLLACLAPSLIAALGAKDETAHLAVYFLRLLLISLPMIAVAVVGSAVLRAQGMPSKAAMVTLTGAIINTIMDPLLMFGLHMGFTGAAVATILAQVGMMIIALRTVRRSELHFAPFIGADRWANLRAQVFQHIKPLSAFAVPAILANLATPVGNAYLTRTMSAFGNDAVAGFAIIGRLTPIAFAFVFAMSGAIGPIVAQNAGGKRYDRVHQALLASYQLSALYTVIVAFLLWLLLPVILHMFPVGANGNALITLFCGPLALFWMFTAWLFCANAGFNNLSKPLYSTILNWTRQTVFVIPFTMVATHYWQAAGVLIGPAIGGAILGTAAMLLSLRLPRKQEALMAQAELG
ncbi:MAG: MATE family efflux transporter [Pseudomonadota bacterium]